MDSYVPISGTCMEMCPESERIKRSKENRLDRNFEKNGAIIKQFSRSAAGKHSLVAKELRPSSVLLKTINYLLSNVATRKDINYCKIYDFINDRIQAIRQDMVIQNLQDENSLEILRKVVRFYLFSMYHLYGMDLDYFDAYLCDKQLMICLKKLLELYSKFQPNSPERELYLAVFVAYNLGSRDVLHNLLKYKLQFPNNVLVDAIQLNRAYFESNFVAFFKILKRLPKILVMCLRRHLPKIQFMAMRVLCIAFSYKNARFPLLVLADWLSLEVEEIAELCKHSGIKVDGGHALFVKSDLVPITTEAPIMNNKCVKIDRDFLLEH